MLWQICYGKHITASRYITADVLRQIYYGRNITADTLRTTKTPISQQVSSARSVRLLHPNLLVATHRPKDSAGPFMYKKDAKVKEIPPGKPHGERSFPTVP